jgi:hypothetical protein
MHRSVTRTILVGAVSAWLFTGIAGCGSDDAETARLAFEDSSGSTSMPAGHPPVGAATPANAGVPAANSVAGLEWQTPAGWSRGEDRSMRVATYLLAAVPGDPEGGECAVYYFGRGQGGDVDANVERWIGQFEQPDGRKSADVAVIDETTVNGLRVTTLEMSGTYTGAMGPMSGAKVEKPGFQMLGAIVEGPEGAVFFKLTGPESTIQATRPSFEELVQSVRKSS